MNMMYFTYINEHIQCSHLVCFCQNRSSFTQSNALKYSISNYQLIPKLYFTLFQESYSWIHACLFLASLLFFFPTSTGLWFLMLISQHISYFSLILSCWKISFNICEILKKKRLFLNSHAKGDIGTQCSPPAYQSLSYYSTQPVQA